VRGSSSKRAIATGTSIAQQYDELVKYATALKLGTAEAQQLLRRFTRGGPKHPPTKRWKSSDAQPARSSSATTSPTKPSAGKSTKAGRSSSIGTAASSSSSTANIFYGKDSELTGEDREEQEISMLAMHLLQSSLVLVNTLIIQQILAEPEWAKRLTDRDKKALNALIWAHINPYGTFHIDMNNHLDLSPSNQNAEAA
jgi:TnpA family transposase